MVKFYSVDIYIYTHKAKTFLMLMILKNKPKYGVRCEIFRKSLRAANTEPPLLLRFKTT